MDAVLRFRKIQLRPITIFLIASLLIHLIVSFVYVSKETNVFSFKDDKQEVNKLLVKLMAAQNRDKKQIVQTEESKLKKKNNSKFLSKTNNTFSRESRSANTGTFKSAAKGSRKANLSKKVAQSAKKVKKDFKSLKFSDLGIRKFEKVTPKKQLKKRRMAQAVKGLKNGTSKGSGLGQTSDHLDNMPLGDFTKLNTQEYEYYGFYHRIRQKLEQFWGLNIQQKAQKIAKSGRSIASESNLITGVVIKLNDAGEIVKIHLNSSSGVKELDDAAIESFNQAGPFPNPPKGMLKNGVATIEWGFVVNT